MVVSINTTFGRITIEIFSDKAPSTVQNFLDYCKDGFYNGTIFSRVVQGFTIQGGGFDLDMKQKQPRASIQNESDNGLKNTRGTVAMARTNELHSANSQFFINLSDNDFLNFSDKSWGYCVFGRVVEGMEVIDQIAEVSTGSAHGYRDVPVNPIVVESVAVIE
ncbi:peptidyl-prolyl cis-trans isomerase ppi1 [Penicillium brevicompactum]|uniref:Peptidyl-prolyl cis-trans isomerase n=1 Tax=Penicillium brevicompactum TaxID=5074 RepID=A0A9W9V2X8_PENBR|nr:peptidyl-prolyl cis-trans isomerase ppi1 [Penicillium brevicompactum]